MKTFIVIPNSSELESQTIKAETFALQNVNGIDVAQFVLNGRVVATVMVLEVFVIYEITE